MAGFHSSVEGVGRGANVLIDDQNRRISKDYEKLAASIKAFLLVARGWPARDAFQAVSGQDLPHG